MSIEEMIEYNENTIQDGIVMPDIESFDKKVSMAISLWPQKNANGGIDYLLGKGVGVELALRGEVVGREKNMFSFPYRSHSDFEIYDCIGYEKIPESKPFVKVFGSQEWYPKGYTKGLHGMDESLMDSTYETVIYNGQSYLIPELEILFLDKYMRQEYTPREEGCDAVLLMQQYKLDIEKINYYYKNYVKKYELSEYDTLHIDAYNKQINSIKKIIRAFPKDENPSPSISDIEVFVNSEINKWRGFKGNLSIFGSPVKFYPDPVKLIVCEDGTISISEENKKSIRELISNDRVRTENYYDSKLVEINDLYNSLYSEVKAK